MVALSIQIPEEIFSGIQITIPELQLEFAVYLYEKRKLTLEQCSKVAGVDILSFQQELGKRKIFSHYDVSDFQQDIATLKKLNRI
jgi:predicted HTH domain antitoxin